MQSAVAESIETSCTVHRTKHPGNASIALRDDGRVCAVGGWDGKFVFSSGLCHSPNLNLTHY